MKFQAVIDGGRKRIEVERIDEGRFRIGDREVRVDLVVIDPGVYSLIVDGASHEVAVRDEKKGCVVEIGAHLIPVRLEDPSMAHGARAADEVEGEAIVSSPMPGRIVGIKVKTGQEVKAGEGMILVEAMKMENELHAPKGGRVKSIAVKVGDAVEAGQDLVVIE